MINAGMFAEQLEMMRKQICCLQERIKELENAGGGNFVSKSGDTMDVDADIGFSDTAESMIVGGGSIGIGVEIVGVNTTSLTNLGLRINNAGSGNISEYAQQYLRFGAGAGGLQIEPQFIIGANNTAVILNRNGFLRHNAGTLLLSGFAGSTSTLTMEAGQHIICDATLGDVIVFLPDTEVVDFDKFTITRIDNSAFLVSVIPVSLSYTISGQPTIQLLQYESITVSYESSVNQFLKL